jgi:hypothetical protein
MKADKSISNYCRLRAQPLWRLLAADNGPIIIALLQTHLFENERRVPASIFRERLHRDLEELRGRGEDIPQTAQAYISDWLNSGYLERRFPAGASEEEYELSSAAANAIRFVISLSEPRIIATESRLATVIHQLVRLSEETDPNPQTRIEALMAERERIDREITSIQKGELKTLPDGRALERVREIILLANELIGDFRNVRDEFEHLNRELRKHILDNDGNRGEVLDALFAGIDLISQSEAGQTFSAFWKLLTDLEQSAVFEDAIEKVISRSFTSQLDVRERRFLLRMTGTLLEQSGVVHEVLQHFARSLKHFVQSREYLEQRRLNHLFKEAQRAALVLKDNIKASNTLDYTLTLTTSRLRTLGQLALFDPSLHAVKTGMTNSEAMPIDLNVISQLVAESEIDFRRLKMNICTVLQKQSQASIANILDRFPASQGLGSIVGYLVLGSRHGIRGERSEIVAWSTKNGKTRARIPAIYFLQDKIHELR